jgi:hypothetical protein
LQQDSSHLWDMDWNLQFNSDPLITGTVSVTNLTTATQNFTVNLFLPVSPAIAGPTDYRGRVSATVFDKSGTNGKGVVGLATLDDWTGDGIYSGLIDGSSVLPLFAFSPLQCGPSDPACSATSADYSAGWPGFTNGGPGVNSSIGTTLKFSLSAGDRVTFDTLFEVVPAGTTPVPVPAAIWLLTSALFGMLGIARRR